jgi:hypothetical protein
MAWLLLPLAMLACGLTVVHPSRPAYAGVGATVSTVAEDRWSQHVKDAENSAEAETTGTETEHGPACTDHASVFGAIGTPLASPHSSSAVPGQPPSADVFSGVDDGQIAVTPAGLTLTRIAVARK